MSSEHGTEQAGGAAPSQAAVPPVSPGQPGGDSPPGHGAQPAAAALGGAAQAGGATATAGAGVPAERKVFRLPGSLIAWWVWVVFATANLVDLAITGRDHTAADDRDRPGRDHRRGLHVRPAAAGGRGCQRHHRAEPFPRSPGALGLGDLRGPGGIGPGPLRPGAWRQAPEGHPHLGAVHAAPAPAPAGAHGAGQPRGGCRGPTPRRPTGRCHARRRRSWRSPRRRSWRGSWTRWPGTPGTTARPQAHGWSPGPGSPRLPSWCLP